jgi:hypothetical protein
MTPPDMSGNDKETTMGGIFVAVEDARTRREMVRPWWWGLVVTEYPGNKLYIDCDRYPELCGEIPVPVERFPPELSSGFALLELLGSDAYPNPDGTGPDPDGPWGPVIRDSIAALGILQLAQTIGDRQFGAELQRVAADLVQRQAEQVQDLIAQG